MTLGSEPPELSRALRAAEDDAARQRREVVYIFRPDGTLVYHGIGEQDAVPVPRHAIRGSILVHNHPNGGSLSRRDVGVLLEQQAMPTRVVTRDWTYVLDRPADTAWADVEYLVAILMDEVRERHRDLILAGKLTYEDSEENRWHEIWEAVAAIRGWSYRRASRTTS